MSERTQKAREFLQRWFPRKSDYVMLLLCFAVPVYIYYRAGSWHELSNQIYQQSLRDCPVDMVCNQ